MYVTSNFFFSHNVFKSCLLLMRQNEYLWSKGLSTSVVPCFERSLFQKEACFKKKPASERSLFQKEACFRKKPVSERSLFQKFFSIFGSEILLSLFHINYSKYEQERFMEILRGKEKMLFTNILSFPINDFFTFWINFSQFISHLSLLSATAEITKSHCIFSFHNVCN